jgi:hypothetical protein
MACDNLGETWGRILDFLVVFLATFGMLPVSRKGQTAARTADSLKTLSNTEFFVIWSCLAVNLKNAMWAPNSSSYVLNGSRVGCGTRQVRG